MRLRKQIGRLPFSELVFAVLLLSAYAVILVSADPEWFVWAGQMTVGALPLEAAPPAGARSPMEILHASGSMSVIGLLVAALFFAVGGWQGFERLAWIAEHARAWLCHNGHGVAPGRGGRG